MMAEDRYYDLSQNMRRNSKYAVQGNYFTQLPPEQEAAFRQWVQQNNVPFNPKDAISDYDMRGFYQALQQQDPRAVQSINPHDKQIHYPDTWKTPYHATFSNESQWAMPHAPRWEGSRLVLPNGQIVHDEAQQ